jgi:hypothetical protein
MWIPTSVITFICLYILVEYIWETIDDCKDAKRRSIREEKEGLSWGLTKEEWDFYRSHKKD